MPERTTGPTEAGFAAGAAGHGRQAPEGPILLVTPTWSRHGGIAAHVLTSAAALAERGSRVEVLVQSIESDERPAGVLVHEAPRLLDPAATALERLGPAATLAPSLVHFHQLEDLELTHTLQARAPVLFSVHGYLACTADEYYFKPGQECTRSHGPMCIPNLALGGCAHTRDPRPLPAAYRRTTRAVRGLHASDMTISYSSAVDRHLAANAIEPRRIVPLFATVAPPPEGEPAPNRVLFAGRVVPSKGLASLIRAAPGLDAEFVVCGDGWQLEEMRRLARTLGVGERFDFRGWVSPQELAHELSLASLLVIPSIWPEPFGLVGIEALQARRPVVASATGGIADWLRDGVSGLLCPPGDAPALASAVAELLADPQRRRRMGEAGRRDVLERFSPSRHTDALLEAYAGARAGWRMRPPAPAGGGDR